MLSLEASKVASFNFLWSLGWLHLNELKGVIGECMKPMCQLDGDF